MNILDHGRSQDNLQFGICQASVTITESNDLSDTINVPGIKDQLSDHVIQPGT